MEWVLYGVLFILGIWLAPLILGTFLLLLTGISIGFINITSKLFGRRQ